MTDEPIKIAMWSGPRNISTAMMRAFENRSDCRVIDEPFYASYMAITGLDHPMRADILAHHETDWRRVAAELEGELGGELADDPDGQLPAGPTLYYQKHMTHHMVPEIGRGWMAACRHAFLIRRPERVLASYARKRADVTLADIGFEQQAALFDHARALTGVTPPVIDADALLANPPVMIEKLCRALAIPFDSAMLTWPPGKRFSDGIWADHWYDAVRKSTGFQEANTAPELEDARLIAVADAARPHYDYLGNSAISAN